MKQPFIITHETQERIKDLLGELIKLSLAKCALLIGQDGKCLAHRGSTRSLDLDSLASLVAGCFASTRALAQLVGERDFAILFHQGRHDHIHNLLISDELVLTLIFDDRTTLGLVRLYARETGARIRRLLETAGGEETTTPSPESMKKEISEKFDDLFSTDDKQGENA